MRINKNKSIANQQTVNARNKSSIEHISSDINALYPRFILVLLAVLLGSIIIVIIYSLNKGFDFTDEGGFLLSYKYVSIYRGGVYNYHIVITKLTNWLNPGIIEYRWMSFIITILSSFTLAIGLYKWLNANYRKISFYKNFVFIFCFISIGNFLYYFPGLQTIYNNTLTNLFLQVATGLVLYLFSYGSSKLIESKTNLFILSIIGFICGFSFFIKFSTGILQLSAYLLIFYLHVRKQTLRHISIVIFTICFGCVIGILIYFSFFEGFNEWIYNFKKEYSMMSYDHQPYLLIVSYFLDILSLIKFSLIYFSWLMIFPLCILMNHYFPSYFKHRNNQYIMRSVLFISVVFFIYEIIHFKCYRSSFASDQINAYFYITIISLQIVLLLAIGLSKRIDLIQLLKINFNQVLIIFLLLIMPFCGAIGTANPIFLNILIHAAPWFAVIVILLIYLSEHIKSKIILSLFIIITSLVTTSQIIDGNTFIPYHSIVMNKSNVFQQTEQVDNVPQLNGIYVDIKTKTFLIELKQILKENNFRKGYPIWGYYIPGVVYLLDGTSPGVPYYYNAKRDLRSFECFRRDNDHPIIIDSSRMPIDNDLLKIMNVKGITYPDNYSLKGEVYFPSMDSMLKIYFPKL